jgi:hypothetical protein
MVTAPGDQGGAEQGAGADYGRHFSLPPAGDALTASLWRPPQPTDRFHTKTKLLIGHSRAETILEGGNKYGWKLFGRSSS